MCALCSAAAGEVNPGTITGETGKVMCEAGVYRRRSNTFSCLTRWQTWKKSPSVFQT